MISRRQTVGLASMAIGAIALIWVSGVAFWLALGLITMGALVVLLPGDGGRTTPWMGGFARFTLVIGSVFVCLMLLEAMLWVLERAAAQPLPTFVARADAVPLPPEIETKI